jgi:hypothetical protein
VLAVVVVAEAAVAAVAEVAVVAVAEVAAVAVRVGGVEEVGAVAPVPVREKEANWVEGSGPAGCACAPHAARLPFTIRAFPATRPSARRAAN